MVVSSLLLWLAMRLGVWIRTTTWRLPEEEREDFKVIQGACFTLLGLIIGFSFSMAIGRYDHRRGMEEEEANAIGTEYVRTDLLPSTDGLKVRGLLKNYLDQRILFYSANAWDGLSEIEAVTSKLQAELWAAVSTSAAEHINPMTAMTVTGMNDVLNSQGYALAAWRNRIPVAAWILMEILGICCMVSIGYSAHSAKLKEFRFVLLPLLIAISFFLIADIDSPNGGVIRVSPENLITLAQSLQGK